MEQETICYNYQTIPTKFKSMLKQFFLFYFKSMLKVETTSKINLC